MSASQDATERGQAEQKTRTWHIHGDLGAAAPPDVRRQRGKAAAEAERARDETRHCQQLPDTLSFLPQPRVCFAPTSAIERRAAAYRGCWLIASSGQKSDLLMSPPGEGSYSGAVNPLQPRLGRGRRL